MNVGHRLLTALMLCVVLHDCPIGRCDEPASAATGHRVLGNDRGKVAIIDPSGRVEWEYASGYDGHDVWLLPGRNVLLAAGPTRIAEVTPAKQVAWSYESKPKAGYA